MIWILLRSPKMKGAIFGFQKRVWCPKWTPASSICRIDTLAMKTPCRVEPPRVPIGNPGILESLGRRPKGQTRPEAYGSDWARTLIRRIARAPGRPCRHACGVVKNSRALYHERSPETKLSDP